MEKIDFKERYRFSEEDKIVLEGINKKLLEESIEFLKSYKKVEWTELEESNQIEHNDGSISYKEQPLPIYPKELKKILCLCDANVEYKSYLFKPYVIPSFMSPYEIISFIDNAYQKDEFCDGYFGMGVKDNTYLSMLLHLKDLLNLYDESIKNNN